MSINLGLYFLINLAIIFLLPIEQLIFITLSFFSVSLKGDFNEEAVKEYFQKKIDLDSKKFDNSLLKDPFFFS